MNLIIDIGNTRAKYAIFDNNQLIEQGEGLAVALQRISAVRDHRQPLHVLLAATGPVPPHLPRQLAHIATSFHRAIVTPPLPIPVLHAPLETLGVDRLAAALAAIAIHPNRDILVVSAGTAITYNRVLQGQFAGGNITPGLHLRYLSLRQYTARLPLVHGVATTTAIATTTRDAIQQGVTRGVIAEINAQADDFRRAHPSPVFLLTGGDAPALAPLLLDDFQLEPNLVFNGLNQLLEYKKATP
ncbi:MAG: type III pantothenate kinase [Odoribacteraceae bacterium]|jgi:type III pantothenate kinase|nr:type III pantothenate kinase [Odoribacteraceae bacterium]